MQIGETASPGMIASIDHDDECYFCNAKEEPKEEENDVDDDPDDDSLFDGLEEDGIKFKNDSSKLGSALGKDGQGNPGKRRVDVDDNSFQSSTAAHHLIPGNASLKKSKFFEQNKYIWTKGKRKGNIGYNVNSATNGVWLPGNYSMRGKWTPRALQFKSNYAAASIDEWKAQFHDSHEDYSDIVLGTLNAIFNKLEQKQRIICPEAEKKESDNPEEQRPLYVLVGRLNTISRRMRMKLVKPVNNWFRNVYTSNYSLVYMNRVSPAKRRRK